MQAIAGSSGWSLTGKILICFLELILSGVSNS
jgi:hypothetical protein